jgi:asparagine synthase (glutamine-hydrolysing)
MCGICGEISFDHQEVSESLIRNMMQTMKHRGPDDEGIYIEQGIGLGFVRLSIIDLSPMGHQPMIGGEGNYVVVFNGEIYNYIELRSELKSIGYSFGTNSDTEVLLNAFIEWGEDCLHRFNGMWAFAIYDKVKKKIFCARDRYGVKPFYYFLDENRFIFASEIPPILKILSFKPQADYQSVYDYLVYNRTDQTEATFFQGIKKLQHGYSITLTLDKEGDIKSNGGAKPKQWYNLSLNLKDPFLSPEEFHGLLYSSIKLRLRSDVPVGVCLSGGLDSSSIVSVLLKDFKLEGLNTFSAVYSKGKTGDESEFINEFKSSHLKMDFITPSCDTLVKDLSEFVRAHAEPIPTTAPYAQFKVMQLAGKKVVVTLDGQGADEILAGYHYFFGIYFKHLFIKLKWLKLIKEQYYYLLIHRSLYGFKTMVYFLLPSWLKNNLRVKEKGYLTKTFVRNQSKASVISNRLYSSKSLQEALIDHFEYKLEHLLKWEDRNSMWFSIEARVPFLDFRLVERSLAMPPQKMIMNGMTKTILREAMKEYLPEKICSRVDKIGFDTPQADWFKEQYFKEYITELINSKTFRSRGIINYQKAVEIFNKHLEGKKDFSKEIWKWIHLELWFREYVDVPA